MENKSLKKIAELLDKWIFKILNDILPILKFINASEQTEHFRLFSRNLGLYLCNLCSVNLNILNSLATSNGDIETDGWIEFC